MATMRKNMIPAIIAFAPALLLPLIQDVMRPRIHHTGPLGFVLSVAPDFVVGVLLPLFDSDQTARLDFKDGGEAVRRLVGVHGSWRCFWTST
jgi:hypothetical protein